MSLFSRVVAGLLGACVFSTGVALAAAPTGETIDGISCDQAEGAVFHIHQHLAIFDHGRAVGIPDDVGRPIVGQCLYWLHTHTADGIIHVESPAYRSFTLGQFFDIWGEALSANVAASAHAKPGTMRVYVDGRPYRGDPRKIELAQHTDITIEAGPPYHVPVAFTNWQGQ
jgi:hypothetical protein